MIWIIDFFSFFLFALSQDAESALSSCSVARGGKGGSISLSCILTQKTTLLVPVLAASCVDGDGVEQQQDGTE